MVGCEPSCQGYEEPNLDPLEKQQVFSTAGPPLQPWLIDLSLPTFFVTGETEVSLVCVGGGRLLSFVNKRILKQTKMEAPGQFH